MALSPALFRDLPAPRKPPAKIGQGPYRVSGPFPASGGATITMPLQQRDFMARIWVEARPDKNPEHILHSSAFPIQRNVSVSPVLRVATHEHADSCG